MPDPVAVPPEILARMADTMAEGVTVARDTRATLDRLAGEVATLRQSHAEHAAREEPALAAHHDWVMRLATEEGASAVRAKVAADERVAAEALTRKDVEIERQKAAVTFWRVVTIVGAALSTAASVWAASTFGGTHAP